MALPSIDDRQPSAQACRYPSPTALHFRHRNDIERPLPANTAVQSGHRCPRIAPSAACSGLRRPLSPCGGGPHLPQQLQQLLTRLVAPLVRRYGHSHVVGVDACGREGGQEEEEVWETRGRRSGEREGERDPRSGCAENREREIGRCKREEGEIEGKQKAEWEEGG